MLRPIPAAPRFTLLTAIAVLLASLLLEVVAGWVFTKLYVTGAVSGLYPLMGDMTDFAPLMHIWSKVLAAIVVTAVLLAWTREPWAHLGRMGFRPIALGLAFVPIIAATSIFLSEIDNLLRSLDAPDGLETLDISEPLGDVIGNSWISVLLVVVVAPVTEELIFRGIVLRGLLARWRTTTAIIISALLFALMHMNPVQFPIAVFLGLVIGWTYTRTRSLGLCMVVHGLNNGSSFFGDWVPFQVDNYNHVPASAGTFFHPWWFDAGGLALVGTGLWMLHKLAPPAEPWRVPPTPVPPLVATPAMQIPAERGCQTAQSGNTEPSMPAELVPLITSLAQRARAASLVLATAPAATKNAVLEKLAELIDSSHFELLEANQRDLLAPEASALAPATRDRLTLNEDRLRHLAASVREVVALPDPVGEVLEETTRPNGLVIRKLRVPIGVIGIIFEARPNVTIDCAILCLKSGNAAILRGGKECFHTNMALAGLIQRALTATGLPADAVQVVPTTDRAALNTLLKLDTLIHCIIPRGGESLIRYVAENSTIPVIKHYKGVCFVYVDAAADLTMAGTITVNAKASRPSVCNAAEQLLVHRAVAEAFLPQVAQALVAKSVQLRCDLASAAILARAGIATTPATTADYTTEFLDYILAVRVVDSLDHAIATINRDSSNHSDAIVTADEVAARRFLGEVDSATVYWNASTRFTDGFEFGYGAEIGISTDRLHARGPMGLRELCSHKFLIVGTGQIRG